MQIVSVPMPHLHTLSVAVYVRAGSRYESSADNGLSHFVEHMLFRGTENYPSSLDINLAFESLGSGLHAETGRDYSLYQVSIEPADLPACLKLLAEFLSRPRFSDIALERRLILEEATEDYDEDGNEINGYDLVRSLMFSGDAFAQRIIGPTKNLERYSESDLRRHFETFYGASNMICCVAGPVEHETLMRWATESFSSMPSGSPVRYNTPAEFECGPTFQHIEEAGSQTEIEMIWRGLPATHELYLAQYALLRVLDDGMASRLHYRLCDQKALAYHLGASIESFHDLSLFEIAGSTANHKAATLLGEIMLLMQELREIPISEQELERAKSRARYDMACMLDDPAAMVSWYGGGSLHGEPMTLTERQERFNAIGVGDLMAAAQYILRPERLALCLVGKLGAAQLRSVRSILALGAPASGPAGSAPRALS